MIAVDVLWAVVQIVVGYNLVVPLLFYILSAFKDRKKVLSPLQSVEADYAIIVTAYEQTDFLHKVVSSLLQVNYSNYLIYIVADNCNIEKLYFESEKVILLKPETILASNTKSHFYAINRFKRNHDRITIIDSDNLVDPQYLNELNVFFEHGFSAVQGVRAAKNLHTTFSCLDAARDHYYHFYDGKLLFNLGSSATLAGSGMAFLTNLYKECLERLDIKGAGFDKVLQFEIVKRGYRIAFAEKAIVYDEKTSKPAQLVTQRARWIYTWFKYFYFGFKLLIKGIKRLSLNQLLFGFILLRPPLFIFLVFSAVFTVINLFINPLIASIWMLGIVAFVTSFFIALAKSKTDRRIYASLINIPRFMFYQVLSLSKASKANNISVATRHDFSQPA